MNPPALPLEPQPFGLGYRAGDIDRIVGERREREVRDRAEAATPLLAPHRPKKEEGENKPVISRVSYGSTNADYLTARIARDRPDVLDRMKAGDFPPCPALRTHRGPGETGPPGPAQPPSSAPTGPIPPGNLTQPDSPRPSAFGRLRVLRPSRPPLEAIDHDLGEGTPRHPRHPRSPLMPGRGTSDLDRLRERLFPRLRPSFSRHGSPVPLILCVEVKCPLRLHYRC